MRLHGARGGGGLLSVRGVDVWLTPLQFAFLGRLMGAGVGFVVSDSLLRELPWETPYPGTTGLKRLVRRTRRTLAPTQLAIHGVRSRGYRLADNFA